MKLLLFDIDGTILKVKEALTKSIFTELIADVFKKEIDESILPDFAGMTDLKIITDTSAIFGLNPEETYQILPEFWKKMISAFKPLLNIENIDLLPGVNELIKYYHQNEDYKLGLLTGNIKECAYMKLKPFELDEYFPFGAFGNEQYDRNNLPLIALKRANDYFLSLSFNTENTMIIGDSPMDIKCAKANNIKSLNVATGSYGKSYLESLGADFCFENFANTKDVINKIDELFI